MCYDCDEYDDYYESGEYYDDYDFYPLEWDYDDYDPENYEEYCQECGAHFSACYCEFAEAYDPTPPQEISDQPDDGYIPF